MRSGLQNMVMLGLLGAGLVACGNNDSGTPAPAAEPPPVEPAANAIFEVSATNLTVGQPLSPLAVVAHDASLRLFSVGQSASTALELLAEAGDNSEVLALEMLAAQASGADVIAPGAAETVTLELNDDSTEGLNLTVLTMLVNTNDAFTGAANIDIAGLAVGDSMTLRGRSYDSGTEANTEAAATIPGPAGGGEGFNAARDDVADTVSAHPGVVTADDGLSGSALSQNARWDDPVITLQITRTQ